MFFSFVAASGIAVVSSLVAFELSECSVAASGIGVLSSVVASGIADDVDDDVADDVEPPEELGGLQHLSLQSAFILSSSICVNNLLETI